MTLSHDHVIFLVPEPDRLDAVCDQFRAAGFSITTRLDADRAQATTAQKLVCFQDGSYIEILTIHDAALRAKHRFAPYLAQGEGWVDYSLVTDDLAALIRDLQAAEAPFSGPHSHERRLENGKPWGVKLVQTGIGAGLPALPFVLEDTSGRARRIPGQNTRHANGVIAMPGVLLRARDTALVSEALGGIGIPPGPGNRFALNGGFIELHPATEAELPEGAPALQAVYFRRPGSAAGPLAEADAAGLKGFLIA